MNNEFTNELKQLGISFSGNEPMSKHSTMRIGENADYFAEVGDTETLKKLLQAINKHGIKLFIIGDGSNTVFVHPFEGIVIKPSFKGVEILKEDSEHIYIKAASGENWHQFVTFCVEYNYPGIENMALIPGTIGAAPVQNIAAYGGNQVDVFEELTAMEIATGNVRTFSKDECKYEYRTSIFKRELKDKYIILDVTYRLNKEFKIEANYHERYLSLASELKEQGPGPYTLKNVYNAVISLRNKKLPKVEEWGTLGSFFKNPVVTKAKFEELSGKINELQSYPVDNLQYNIKNWNEVKADYLKIPAGRLLDELGWKGKWEGNIGTFDKHALCVITNGKGTSKELVAFVQEMKESVKNAYGIELELEVNLV